MTNIKLIYVSALGCHPQGVYRKKVLQVQHSNLVTDDNTSEGYQYLKWHSGLVSLWPSRNAEDGTSVQKHLGG